MPASENVSSIAGDHQPVDGIRTSALFEGVRPLQLEVVPSTRQKSRI
jgi:hypothetical protein